MAERIRLPGLMSNTRPHIALLCNNRMAVPALQTLHGMGLLCAIGVPENNADIMDFCSVFAAQTGIPLQLFRKEDLAAQLNNWVETSRAETVFMMTFPWKIPAEVLSGQAKFYNFHYGLLPEMRGADPVFESLRQQKKETGITVHAVEKGIDRGPVLFRQPLPLSADMTHGLLCTQLAYLGARIIPEVLNSLQHTGQAQDESGARYFKRPGLAEVCVRWESQDAAAAAALARACNPWNKGAYTQWNGWNVRIVEATPVQADANGALPGTVLSIDREGGLCVQCKDNTQLKIDIIYTDEGFMSGHRLLSFGMKKGDRFTTIQ